MGPWRRKAWGNGNPSGRPRETGATAGRADAGQEPVAPAGAAEKKRRNPWIWISALLAVVSIGVLVWALTVQSDSDNTQEELDSTQHELAGTQQKLDATTQELDDTKQDVEALQSAEADPEKRGGRALADA